MKSEALFPHRGASRLLGCLVLLGLLAQQALPAATGPGSLPPEQWQQIRAAEPKRMDLTPTPSPQAPARLSLKESVELAFKHNASFRQEQASLVNSKMRLWVADQRLFYTASSAAERSRPTGGAASARVASSASTRWERLGGDAMVLDVGSGSQQTFGDLTSQRPALSLSYDRPLLRGAGLASSTGEQVRSARSGLLQEELSFYDARQGLASEVINRYVQASLARGETEIAQRAVDRAKQFYDFNYMKFTGEGLVQPGETWVSQVREIDVSQARLSLEQAKQSLISRQQAFQDAMDNLLLSMGFASGATVELVTVVEYAPQDYQEAALASRAVTNSTRLAGLQLAREDQVAVRRIAGSQARPDLIASLGVTDAGETLGGQTVHEGWFAGVRLEMPLGDRGRGEAKARAERNLQVLDQQLVAGHDQVAQEVQQLVRAANSAKARIAIGEETVKLAQKNREQAQGMFDEGLSDYLRVLDADDRLVQAERSLLQEKATYYLTTVRIRTALGEDITQGLPG